MANFVNESAIEACAASIAADIPLERPRKRLEALFFSALREDERSSRRARPADLWRAPRWAFEALAQGLPCDVFVACADTVNRLAQIAGHVRDICLDAANAGDAGRETMVNAMARRLIGKIERMALDDISVSAREIARARRQAQRERAEAGERLTVHFQPERIIAGPGREWRRVCSIAALSEVGAALDNCLRHDRPQHARYAHMLRTEEAQFWALYAGETVLAAAMSYTELRCVHEVRGPRNARIQPADPDLRALLRAKELCLLLHFMDTQHRVPEHRIDAVLTTLAA
ncbi:MAG: hypothetical protein AB7L65_11385 [Hyphomonadaceae bacterium]